MPIIAAATAPSAPSPDMTGVHATSHAIGDGRPDAETRWAQHRRSGADALFRHPGRSHRTSLVLTVSPVRAVGEQPPIPYLLAPSPVAPRGRLPHSRARESPVVPLPAPRAKGRR